MAELIAVAMSLPALVLPQQLAVIDLPPSVRADVERELREIVDYAQAQRPESGTADEAALLTRFLEWLMRLTSALAEQQPGVFQAGLESGLREVLAQELNEADVSRRLADEPAARDLIAHRGLSYADHKALADADVAAALRCLHENGHGRVAAFLEQSRHRWVIDYYHRAR